MIKTIEFCGKDGILCKSKFYSCSDHLNRQEKFIFNRGVNLLIGEIDDGNFAVSYLLSMYNKCVRKRSFNYPLVLTIDGQQTDLEKFTKRCCYLDEGEYPLLKSKRKTVRQLIKKGLKKSKIDKTPDEVIELFRLTPERIDRPICSVGNERFRAMAAVGYSYGKEVFCFPWLSKRMFDYYTNNILWLLDIFEELKVIAIVPVGK